MRTASLLLLLLREVDSGLLAVAAIAPAAVPRGRSPVAAARARAVRVVGPAAATSVSVGSPVPARRTVARRGAVT